MIEAGFSAEDVQASVAVYADVESPYSYGADTDVKTLYETDSLYAILRRFMKAHGLPWELVLSSYEYTAQDKLSVILDRAGCAAEAREALYAEMRAVQRK